MRYIDEVCPYCGQEFADGDDIVVCPECGTPHHRGCWFAHGCCANSEKHGEGFVWQKNVQPEQEKVSEPEQTDEKKSLDIVCPDCGKACPNGTLRCPDCGAMLIPFGNMGLGESPVAQFRPGFDANEDIGGYKAGDIAMFCRSGGAHYVKSFRKIADKNSLTWNWGAVFFPAFWFFYRKLYKAGAFFMTIFVALGLVSMPIMEKKAPFDAACIEILEEMSAVMEAEGSEAAIAVYEERLPDLLEIMYSLRVPIIIDAAISVAVWLLRFVAAIIADRLYWKKAKAEITAVRESITDERAAQLELFKKGGTSIIGGAAAYFANEMIMYAAAWFITH